MINTTTASKEVQILYQLKSLFQTLKIALKELCIGVWKSTSPIIDLFLIEGLEAHYDMIVVGGGAIGCSVAFWLMQRVTEGFKILVVERDPQVLTFVICAVLMLPKGSFTNYVDKDKYSIKQNSDFSHPTRLSNLLACFPKIIY